MLIELIDVLTIIDTLHKEGKPHTSIAKEAGCSQSAVSKHVTVMFDIWKSFCYVEVSIVQCNRYHCAEE